MAEPRIEEPLADLTFRSPAHRTVATRFSAEAAAERRRGVQVAGTTIISGKRVVIVQLGGATLAEAKETICRQAAVHFREALAGERLRVQRHRGSQPAVEIGSLVCD